jgi:hypothetical protein
MQAALFGGVRQDLGGAFAAAAALPLKEARVSFAALTGWSRRLPALSIFLCCVLVHVPPSCTADGGVQSCPSQPQGMTAFMTGPLLVGCAVAPCHDLMPRGPSGGAMHAYGVVSSF